MSTATPKAAEAARISTSFVLMQNTASRPELKKAEHAARSALASAIIDMDAVEQRITDGEKVHSLGEQAAVEQAKDTYAQALADLVRGESSAATETSTANQNREH